MLTTHLVGSNQSPAALKSSLELQQGQSAESWREEEGKAPEGRKLRTEERKGTLEE